MENYYLKKKEKIKYKELFITTFLTHGGSNLISKLLVSPLERIVIIRQTQPFFFRNVLLHSSFTYSNIVRGIYAKQGLTSLWWGYHASIWNFLSFSFFRLLFHDKIKYNLAIENSKKNYLTTFFLLYTSSCFAAAISYPLDTIHNCMALNHETVKNKKLTSRGIFLFIYDLVLKRKLKHLYAGYSLCLLNFIPYLLISIKLNEIFTKHFIEINSHEKNGDAPQGGEEQYADRNISEEYRRLFKKTPNVLSYIFLGVLTGYISQVATYPLETIRRKYQYHVIYEKNFPQTLMHSKNWKVKKPQKLIAKISNVYRGFSLHTFKLIPEYLIFSCFFYYVKNNMPI
ncbi:ADP,ATP carrier protein 2, putative [Plasmodium vivax]|uniref:ADP/ATP carrier protein n=1 Tax=Plasmodium vivax (strain Brazil I) TaxID=1033975 RepID=A0A0J9SVP7_PLAV1|nr:ADP/ATP carrier protein [Plasmodium vivax Brazil I]CAI7719943.1 ADP,ATP carrier protein 2, putative [Plasmodium vivax]